MKLDQIQVYYGQVSNLIADVCLRFPDQMLQPDSVRAHLKGPYCSLARTLPSTSLFQAEESGVWRARIVDPVCWSPDYPANYRLHVDVGGECFDIECAVRQFGCRGKDFWLNGKRWVVRGARADHVDSHELAGWHDARMVMWVRPSSDSLLAEAARRGVMLAVEVDERTPGELLVAMSHCPAVVLVSLPAESVVARWRPVFPNASFVKPFEPHSATAPPADADAILCHTECEVPRSLEPFGRRPLIAFRPLTNVADATAARTGCDRLQRDLAPHFDLSGYVV